MRLLLLLLIPISGCGLQPIKTYDYSWGTITRAPQRVVNDTCSSIKTRDDGSYIRPGTNYSGCIHGKKIIVRNDCIGAEAIPHELAHMDGVDDPDEEGYSWESE